MSIKNKRSSYGLGLHSYGLGLLSLFVLHLKQIPLIILYPIGASINIVHSLLAHVYIWALNLFDNAKSRKKRLTRLIRKAVRSVIGGLSNAFGATWSRTLCKLFTLLLQIVSFLTTYAGFSFFVKHIHPLAPLFLAFVVQGGVFFLMNAYTSRKHDGNWKRHLLLVFLLLVSTLTSFVGVSNKIQDPTDDMKDSYNKYLSIHNKYLSDVVNNAECFTQDDIQAALNCCVKVRNEAETTLKMIPEAIPEKTTSDSSSRNWQYNPDGSLGGFGDSQESLIEPELETLKKTLEALLVDLQETIENLRYDPSALRSAGIYRAISSASEKDPSPESYLNFLNCIEEYRYLAEKVNEVRETINQGKAKSALLDTSLLDTSIFARKRLQKYNMAIEQRSLAMLYAYEDIIGSSNATDMSTVNQTPVIQTAINALFSGLDHLLMSPDLTRAEQIRTLLNQEMRNKHELLVSFGGNDISELDEQYESSLIPSTQLYPFRYLIRFSSPSWGTSLLALLFASMIDMLSLLIALTLVKRRDSILYAKNHKEDTRNREEILEDCYTYLCLKNLDDSNSELFESPVVKNDIRHYVSQTLTSIMTEFLRQVQFSYIPDSLDSFGYLTTTQVSNFTLEDKNLFQTFRLIHLIRPVTKEELVFLLNATFPVPTDDTKTSLPKAYIDDLPDEILYLVDNRLLMWFNENLSEFLSDNITSDGIIKPFIEPESLDM